MNKLEKIFIGVFTLIGVIIFMVMVRVNWQGGYGDNALFAQVTENFIKTEYPKTQLGDAIGEFIFKNSGLATMKADEFRSFDFSNTNYIEGGNILRIHLYLIIYPISLLAIFLPVYWVWSLLISISFIGLLLLVYLYLRNKKLPIWSALIFVFLVLSHPAWNYAIQGQIYPDRLFLLLGMAFLLLLDNKKNNKIGLIVLAILAASIVEKTLLMVFLLTFGYLVLNWKLLSQKKRFFYLILSILEAGICVYVFKFFLVNFYYSSFMSVASVTNFFSNVANNLLLRQNLEVFFLMNGVFLLLGLFNWRSLILALGAMVPNIFGSIGGAEKIGWTTHYHSIYFPVLVWSAMKGYEKVFSLMKKEKKWMKFLSLVLVLVGIFYMAIYPYSVIGIKLSKSNFFKSGLIQGKDRFIDFFKKDGYYALMRENQKKLTEVIPEYSSVSVNEVYWVSLYKNRKMRFYPLGINEVDYIVLRAEGVGTSKVTYRGFVSYLGDENAKKIDEIILKKMKEIGFNIDNPIIIDNMAIFIKK